MPLPMQVFCSPAPRELAVSSVPPVALKREVKGMSKTIPMQSGSHYMAVQLDHWIKVKMKDEIPMEGGNMVHFFLH